MGEGETDYTEKNPYQESWLPQDAKVPCNLSVQSYEVSVSRDFRSMTFFFIYQPITDIAFEFVTMLDSTLNNLDFEELKMTHKSCSGIFHYELYAKY